MHLYFITDTIAPFEGNALIWRIGTFEQDMYLVVIYFWQSKWCHNIHGTVYEDS